MREHRDPAFRSWLWYAGLGGVALVGYVVLAHAAVPAIVPVLWCTAISASGAVALVLGARLHRPARRLPWYLPGAGGPQRLVPAAPRRDLHHVRGRRRLRLSRAE